jgi:protein-tyrosine phosphatase
MYLVVLMKVYEKASFSLTAGVTTAFLVSLRACSIVGRFSGRDSGNMKTVKVLFVCMGNICRSPTAQGVFERLVREANLSDRVHTDSAGTHAYHVGEVPDQRATEAAQRRGVDLTTQRARRVSPKDFEGFDYVLAMDSSNYDALLGICRPEHTVKLRLFMEFAPGLGVEEVPDPYYGGVTGFERVLDLIEEAADGLLAEIRQQHGF